MAYLLSKSLSLLSSSQISPTASGQDTKSTSSSHPQPWCISLHLLSMPILRCVLHMGGGSKRQVKALGCRFTPRTNLRSSRVSLHLSLMPVLRCVLHMGGKDECQVKASGCQFTPSTVPQSSQVHNNGEAAPEGSSCSVSMRSCCFHLHQSSHQSHVRESKVAHKVDCSSHKNGRKMGVSWYEMAAKVFDGYNTVE